MTRSALSQPPAAPYGCPRCHVRPGTEHQWSCPTITSAEFLAALTADQAPARPGRLARMPRRWRTCLVVTAVLVLALVAINLSLPMLGPVCGALVLLAGRPDRRTR